MLWLSAVHAQLLTAVANLAVFSFLSTLALVVSPLSTPAAFYIHLTNIPLVEQLRLALFSFSKKRYMIGQDGRKPFGSFFVMSLLAAIGLLFFFLPTIIFQASQTSLRQSIRPSPPLPTATPPFSSSSISYPVISDSLFASPSSLLPSSKWSSSIPHAVSSISQFSGNSSIYLSDTNWATIKESNYSSTFSLSIDPISFSSLSTSPASLSLQLLNNGSPAVLSIPSSSPNPSAFAIQGKLSTDLLLFNLISFDFLSLPNQDNLLTYYDFVNKSSFSNISTILNNTFDYNNSKEWDKSDLEAAFADPQSQVRYSLLSIQNNTRPSDSFQSYILTKRTARRQDKISSQNATIDLVNYVYSLSIVRYPASQINPSYKPIYNNYRLPCTPLFSSSLPDFVLMATLLSIPALLVSFVYETYIDVLPTVILIAVFTGLSLLFSTMAAAYNFHRFSHKAYSIHQESLNYLLYHPARVLYPLIQKIRPARFDLVDGYDPVTGYNHLGLVPPEDAAAITKREPDVPYGLAPNPHKKGMLA